MSNAVAACKAEPPLHLGVKAREFATQSLLIDGRHLCSLGCTRTHLAADGRSRREASAMSPSAPIAMLSDAGLNGRENTERLLTSAPKASKGNAAVPTLTGQEELGRARWATPSAISPTPTIAKTAPVRDPTIGSRSFRSPESRDRSFGTNP